MSTNNWNLTLYKAAQIAIEDGSVECLRGLFSERAEIKRINGKAKNGGSGWRNVFKRIDSGKRPDVFKKGNGKLPFYAFSSLAGIDCPQAGACLYLNGDKSNDVMTGFCYSFKAWRYPAAFMRQVFNSMRLRSDTGRNEIIKSWLELPEGSVVRLYVDGDFANIDILKFWMRLCFARPDLKVYGYSKSWNLLLQYHSEGGRWPANYLLNISSGGSGSEAQKMAVSMLPITRGEFIAVHTTKNHGNAYQSKTHKGFKDYAADVRQSAGKRVFVCSGKCGDCIPDGHACGTEKFKGVSIAIGVH